MRTGRFVYVSPVVRDGLYPSEILAAHGVQSYCVLPLVTARGTLGSLNFGSLERDAYSADDIELMTRVAKLVAVGVENATSLETIQQQRTTLQGERDQLDLLLEATNAVVTHLDTAAIFRAVVPALRRCCKAEFAALALYDADARVLRKHVCDGPGCSGPPTPAVDVPVDASLTGWSSERDNLSSPGSLSCSNIPRCAASSMPESAPRARCRWRPHRA